MFNSPFGKKVLGHLHDLLEVDHTLEPGQLDGKPICPITMAVRKGRRDAYYLILNQIELGNAIRMEMLKGEQGDDGSQ